jgi:hypothetical protein
MFGNCQRFGNFYKVNGFDALYLNVLATSTRLMGLMHGIRLSLDREEIAEI